MKLSAVVSDKSYPPTTVEDKAATLECVRRAQTGDVAAFETLYRENSARVFALCLRLSGGDRTDATELMQDVFVRAWRRLETFRGDSAFSSWLHRLAVNTMLESARSERRRSARVLSMEDTTKGKPDPQVFLIAASKIGIPPERCIVFEDAVAGGGVGLRVLTFGACVAEGGVPIVAGSAIIGGIGVSGAASEQDAQIAIAGAAAITQ